MELQEFCDPEHTPFIGKSIVVAMAALATFDELTGLNTSLTDEKVRQYNYIWMQSYDLYEENVQRELDDAL